MSEIPESPLPSRAEKLAALTKAYGDGEHAPTMAEAELRFQEATCAHLFCDRQAYEDGGVQARGIPLCREHAHLIPGLPELTALDSLRAENQRLREAINRFLGEWDCARDQIPDVCYLFQAAGDLRHV